MDDIAVKKNICSLITRVFTIRESQKGKLHQNITKKEKHIRKEGASRSSSDSARSTSRTSHLRSDGLNFWSIGVCPCTHRINHGSFRVGRKGVENLLTA